MPSIAYNCLMFGLKVDRMIGDSVVIGGASHFGITIATVRMKSQFPFEQNQVCTVVGTNNLEGTKLTYWPFDPLQIGEELTVTVVESDCYDAPTTVDFDGIEPTVDASDETKRRIRDRAAVWGWKLKENP